MSVKQNYSPKHAANVANAKLAELPALPTRMNVFDLTSLLSPARKHVTLHHDYGTPLTPREQVIRICRGRLDGQLSLGLYRSYVGARAAPRHQQKWGERSVMALGLSIDCARGLQSTSRQRLLPPFDELHDSELTHAVLAGELLAHLSNLPLEIPLAIRAYQNWKKGYALVQVRLIDRVPGRAEAVLSFLNQHYRYDPYKAQDATTTRRFNELHAADHGAAQAAGAAGGSAVSARETQAGAAPSLFAEREQ